MLVYEQVREDYLQYKRGRGIDIEYFLRNSYICADYHTTSNMTIEDLEDLCRYVYIPLAEGFMEYVSTARAWMLDCCIALLTFVKRRSLELGEPEIYYHMLLCNTAFWDYIRVYRNVKTNLLEIQGWAREVH